MGTGMFLKESGRTVNLSSYGGNTQDLTSLQQIRSSGTRQIHCLLRVKA